ncbi:MULTISPECIES: hypothetical protein [unclassified Hydrogenophaga]|uniref:hypothetical protein n=1 Tax=unclassified Hydrogenophaga TaxID=2610897 RepID=UPI000AE5E7FD|nr:hypothetical protein [Hydrogenophaga sp. Root209]
MEFDVLFHASTKPSPSIGVAKTQKRYKVADVHFHPTNYAQQGTDPLLLLSAMDDLKIMYTTLSPIPTNVLACGCGGNKDYSPATGHPTPQANYYISNEVVRFDKWEVDRKTYEEEIAKDAPLAYNQGVDSDTATRYKQLSEEQKKRFDPMITGLVLGDLRCSEDLLRKLSNNPGVFTGVGEITVHKEWVERKVPIQHQANLTDRSEGLKGLMKTCGVIGMPVVLHCDVDVMPFDRREGAPPAYFEPIKAFLADPDCVNTKIIWAHAGGLGKYSGISDGHLERLKKILDSKAHSHVYFDISWDTVAKQLLRRSQGDVVDDDAKVKAFCNLLSDYPTRFLFGSDSLSPNTHAHWGATADLYAKVFITIDKSVSKALRYDNYQRLLVNARPVVRAYEKYCLPYAMILADMRQDNEIPLSVKEAIKQAVQDGIDVGLALRLNELEKKPIPPEIANLQKKLVKPDELRLIATSIIDKSKPPLWETNVTFKTNYLSKAKL